MRTQIITTQLEKTDALVVGLQEAWNKKGIRRQGKFWAVSSGVDSAGLGCEVWFNGETSYAKAGGKQLFLSRNQLGVLHSHPRFLAVAVSAPHFAVRVASVHAPHVRQGMPKAREFWEEAERLIS
eukprot:1908556-Pyramimonas_sp.AAC.1